MQMLFHAHSGFRYLVLLAAVGAMIVLLVRRSQGKAYTDGGRRAMAIYVGILDFQILLGLGVLAVRPFYMALIGHLVSALAAAGVAHALSVMARRTNDPRRAHAIAVAGIAISLLLVVAAIAAIGRGVFTSTPG